MQRMDETMRKFTLGSFAVLGEEPKLDIMGVLLFRGKDIPEPLAKDHPQFEYWKSRKLNVNDENDRKFISEFWIKEEEEMCIGLKMQTKKFYK